MSVTLPDAGGNLRGIGVQTYAEEGAFAPDIFVKFSVIHDVMVFKASAGSQLNLPALCDDVNIG